MRLYLKLWLLAVPFAIGMVSSLLSVASAVAVLDQGVGDIAVVLYTFIYGLIGFPLLVASTFSILNILERNAPRPDATEPNRKT
jgi:hypothetical protein